MAPGIATAQRFIESRIPVELIISEKEIDSRLLQSYPDIPYRRAKGAPFGWHPVKLFKFIYSSLAGAAQSIQLLRSKRPAAVLAFGGFLSVGYVLAAWTLNIPVVLHEANRKAGRSIRVLSRLARMVFLPEGVSLKTVSPSRITRLGMPLRREVVHIPKSEIRERLGIPMHAKVMTVVGGSQGAAALNAWVLRHRRSIASDGVWINLVTGPGKQELPEREVFKSDIGEEVEVRCFAFHSALHELFSASDIVVSRAGAGTVAELVACLTPSILIPYPFAADQHQLANARDLERRGGCILIEQGQINSLYREVMDLVFNDWLLGRMRTNLKCMQQEDPAQVVCRYICSNYLNTDQSASGLAGSQEGGLA